MAYEKQEWKNGRSGGTPINADRLNHIEDGIGDTDARITLVENQLGTIATTLDEINGIEV